MIISISDNVYYNKALLICREIGDLAREARTLTNLGDVYNSLGENQKAIDYYNQALPIRRAAGDQAGEAITLNNLGSVYSSIGKNQKAIDYFNQSLLIMQAVGDRSGEAATLNNLGLVYDLFGEKQKAIDYFNQSLPISRSVGNQLGEARTLNNLGSVYDSLGEKQKAIDYFNQSLLIMRAVGDRSGEATTLTSLGIVYDSFGENQKAIDYYNQSLPISRAIGDRVGEGRTLSILGLVYSSLGENQKAIDYLNQALPISHAVGNRSGEARTLNSLGSVYDSLGENQRAIDYYNQALPISRTVGDRSIEATTLNNLGSVYSSLGEKQKAIDYLNQALPILRAIGSKSGEARTLDNLAFILNSQKQPEIAIAVYKKSVNIYGSLRQEIRKLPRETQEIYISSVAQTYRYLADLLLEQGRTHEAQSVLELLKVQELQSFENGQESKSSPVQFPIHPLESQALQTIEKSITSKQSLTLETLKTIAQPLTQNRDRITQDMNNSKIAIGNPKAILNANPNAILIQNLVVNDKLWVLWTNEKGNTKAIVVPNVTQKQLSETVTTFRDQIGSPYGNLNALKTTSTQLYNWLIPPQLQTELTQNPKQQLIFSLDHVTRYIPVAALYDGKQYLAQRHTLSNIITTDSNMTDRLTTEGRSPTILALGTSNPHPGFSALPNVEAELNAIVQNGNRGIYPGKIQLNETFTAQSLQTNLDNYRILHIATHGSFNPKSITASFLLLGNGDRLPITDIAKLNNLTTTHLVVLSACETGLSGGGQDGTEISGISGYFLKRGAKSVLASLWSVNDASTALMMQQFYQTLSQTPLTKAQALQKIQQDFISGKLTTTEADAIPRTRGERTIKGQLPATSLAHPYFWAPFILTGNNQ